MARIGGCALSALLVVACGGTERPPSERFENGLLRVDESEIRAALVGDAIEVRVPVQRVRGGTVSGEVGLEIRDAADPEADAVGEGSLSFSLSDSRDEYTVRVEGTDSDLERVDTASFVIHWEVEADGERLYGKRSLYGSLGNLDVQLRGPTELPQSGSSPLRVIVRAPESLDAISDADVLAELIVESEESTEITTLFNGTTDSRGELLEEIALPEGVDSASVRVTVTHDDAQVWTNRSVSRSNAGGGLYLSSDKTIYQPGQEVHLRLLALEGSERAPLADQEVSFEAQDARGNKVFRRSAQTDEFGVASIAVPIDSRVNEGSWSFSASVGERSAEIRLPVERYILPKMRITVLSDREFVTVGDQLAGRVSAAYLFGEPVLNAQVELRASTSTGTFIGTASGLTDEEGAFAFDLTVPENARNPYVEDRGDRIIIDAHVVDTADQEESGTGSVVLAAAPLRINFFQDSSREGVGFVLVSDPLGRPLVADLRVDGQEGPTTDSTGIAEVSFESDASTVEIGAEDGAQRSHQRIFGLSMIAGELRVSSDQPLYSQGDTASLMLEAGDDIERIHVDVYRGAQGILSTSTDVRDGEAELELPISADLGGILVIDALGLKADGTVVTSRIPVFVETSNALRVHIESDVESYAPGEDADLSISVLDSDGAPSVAAIGLTVVDEAVFALAGEPGTSIDRVFGLDTSVLPSGLSIAGRSADEILNTTDPAEREAFSRLLFASATGLGSPAFDYNSYAAELPAVSSRLSQIANRDMAALIERLEPVASLGQLNENSIANYVRQIRPADPFGKYYVATYEETEWGGFTLTLTSPGPDEVADTRDDFAVSREVSYLFRGGSGTLGAGRGGFEDDADGFAGGPGGPAPAPQAPNNAGQAPTDEAEPSEDGEGSSTRTDFRETALVRPTLVTDASGRAAVTFHLPHSITTWRVSADASSRVGQVGSDRQQVRTFQSFFVDFSTPTTLRNGDILELPAVVYNYEETPQDVMVTMQSATWFENLGASTQSITLQPSEVRSVKFQIRLLEAGSHELTIRGEGQGISDSLIRSVQVAPDGNPEDVGISGQLETREVHTVNVPADTVSGGLFVDLVLTPGFAAEAVQGLSHMVREPNGCFEQTTSSAWPNTLVATYMENTGQLTPELRESIIGTVTRGYQRLLTFESPTGGFNWWGDSDPGNRILSAIMLWHLKDLEPLIDTDESVRQRTLDWLLDQQNADGSWDAGDALHAGNEVLGTSEIRSTSFIAWALAHTGWANDAVERAAGYLRSNMPPSDDLYANALAANAMVLADRSSSATTTLLGRLDELRVDLDGDSAGQILWPTDAPSWTGAGGDSAALETTGLVAYGLMQADAYAGNIQGAMRFIIANKDSVGTWYSTQATMNALRALSAAAAPMGSEADGTLSVRVNGALVETIDVSPETNDLVRRFELAEHMLVGDNMIELEMNGTGEVSYQISRQAYRPGVPDAEGPLDLQVEYDRTTTNVGEPVICTALATNNDDDTRNQVMVRVGRAPGMTPVAEDLDALVASGAVSRYEVRQSDVTFYLMGLAAGETRPLEFRLTPGLAVEATAPASEVYAYYEPTLKTTVDPVRFTVLGR